MIIALSILGWWAAVSLIIMALMARRNARLEEWLAASFERNEKLTAELQAAEMKVAEMEAATHASLHAAGRG